MEQIACLSFVNNAKLLPYMSTLNKTRLICRAMCGYQATAAANPDPRVKCLFGGFSLL